METNLYIIVYQAGPTQAFVLNPEYVHITGVFHPLHVRIAMQIGFPGTQYLAVAMTAYAVQQARIRLGWASISSDSTPGSIAFSKNAAFLLSLSLPYDFLSRGYIYPAAGPAARLRQAYGEKTTLITGLCL